MRELSADFLVFPVPATTVPEDVSRSAKRAESTSIEVVIASGDDGFELASPGLPCLAPPNFATGNTGWPENGGAGLLNEDPFRPCSSIVLPSLLLASSLTCMAFAAVEPSIAAKIL